MPKRKPYDAKKLPTPVIAHKAQPCNDNHREPEHLPDAGKKPAIVTARRPGKRFADVPDMTPEEHQRRGDAAAAMFQDFKRQIAEKIRR